MHQTTIECFLIEARSKRKRVKTLLPLHDLDGSGTSLLQLIHSLLTPLQATPKSIDVKQKCAAVANLKQTNQVVSGTVRCGDFGYSSDIIDVKTGNKDYQKKKTNADLIPFFFYMYIPVGAHKGIIALQRFGRQGIKSVLIPLIKEYLDATLPNVIVDLKPLVPDYVMAQYFKSGQVKSIRYTQHSIPSDIADKVGKKKVAQKGKVEVIVTADNAGFFRPNDLAKAIKADTVRDLYAIDVIEPDDIDVTIKIGNQERTIRTGNWGKLKAAFDVSDKVQEGLDGFPDVSSVSKAVQGLVGDLATAAGI